MINRFVLSLFKPYVAIFNFLHKCYIAIPLIDFKIWWQHPDHPINKVSKEYISEVKEEIHKQRRDNFKIHSKDDLNG